MNRIGIIIGSVRPGRVGAGVALWIHDLAAKLGDAEYEVVDLLDYDLPQLDEPLPALFGTYEQPHTMRWASKIASFDGFIFVTPEYNRSIPGGLKDAIDYLHREWNNKAAAVVCYGGTASGARAAEHLRLVLSEVRVATVRDQVAFSLYTDFENFSVLKPSSAHEDAAMTMLEQLLSWTTALKAIREKG